MLKTIMNSYALFWVMGVVVGLNFIGKLIRSIAMRRLVRAAGRMGKSTHKLMKLVKAKFEHTYMLSNGVDNIPAFVDKYLHEYKILGFRLQNWRSFEKQTIWLCGILAILGGAAGYYYGGMEEMTFRYLAVGTVVVLVLFLSYISSDEKYYIRMARIYMIDYLQNICGPRYERQQTLQLRKMEETVQGDVQEVEEAQIKEENEEPETEEIKEAVKEEKPEKKLPKGEMRELKPEKEEKVPQEVILREIIEEFLA